MSHDKPAPKFIKPGDDPELDRMLDEARSKGSEPPGEFYYDVFGRRRRVRPAGAATAAEKSEKGAPGGAVVTETRPAAALGQKQKLWLALGTLAIVGPVVALALGAFRSGKLPQGALAVPMSATSSATMAVPPVVSAPAAPPTMTAVPVVEPDAGAAPAVSATPSAARAEPSAPGAKLGPKGTKPKSTDDPYNEPPKKPPVLVY